MGVSVCENTSLCSVSSSTMLDLITSETGTDSEKDDIQQIAVPKENFKTFGPGQYYNKAFFGIHAFLKRNPSLEFCREVVQMNKEELDPAEVRQVGPQHFDYCATIRN
jgi:hypothetical protein